MIVLDTTAVSTLMKPDLNPTVTGWFDRQPPADLHMASITVMEIWRGILKLPASARRIALEEAFESVVRGMLRERILDFDFQAAIAAADLSVERKRAGRPVADLDTQIAGIAISRGAVVVTRNVRHFSDLPTGVIDPWTDSA
jgi:predicted nucleic acid-binding protein